MKKDLFDYIKIGIDKLKSSKKEEKTTATNPGNPHRQEEGITGKAEEGHEEKPQAEKTWNYTAFQDKMPERILARIVEMGIKESLYAERRLVVYCHDAEKAAILRTNRFNNYLADYIELRKEATFQTITIAEGDAPAGAMRETIDDMITIGIERINVAPEAVASIPPAKVEVMGKRCKLEDPDIILEPEEGKIWNIGWGSRAEINGRVRFNQIAWTYANPDKENTGRFLISRAHAHIKFSKGRFNLFVDPRGTQQAGAKTDIQRGEDLQKLTVVGLSYPLQDGDIIQMNSQCMMFHQTETTENNNVQP